MGNIYCRLRCKFQRRPFDDTSKALELDPMETNQLEWILKSAKHVVLEHLWTQQEYCRICMGVENKAEKKPKDNLKCYDMLVKAEENKI